MSKKTQTTSSFNQSNQYDPASMGAYVTNIHAMMPQMRSMIQNPFNNPFYNLALSQGMAGANKIGASAMQSLGTSLRARGINDNSPAAAAMMQYQNRVNSGMRNNAFLGAANMAQQNYWNAMSGMLNFHPLQTGQTGNSQSTQKVSGLGTWLPQVAGAALGGIGGLASAGMLGHGGFASAMGNMFGSGAPVAPTPAFGAMSPGNISAMYGGPSQVPFTPYQ